MSAKAAEIKELDKLTHEIPKEEEEDTQSDDEAMAEYTNYSGDTLNQTKTPEDVVVMNAMPTR